MYRLARKSVTTSDSFHLFLARNGVAAIDDRLKYWEYPWSYYCSNVARATNSLVVGDEYFSGCLSNERVSHDYIENIQLIQKSKVNYDNVFLLRHLNSSHFNWSQLERVYSILKPGGKCILTGMIRVELLELDGLNLVKHLDQTKFMRFYINSTDYKFCDPLFSGKESDITQLLNNEDILYSHTDPLFTAIGIILLRPYTSSDCVDKKFYVKKTWLHQTNTRETLFEYAGINANHNKIWIPEKFIEKGLISLSDLCKDLNLEPEDAVVILNELTSSGLIMEI